MTDIPPIKAIPGTYSKFTTLPKYSKFNDSSMCMLPFMHLHTWPSGKVFPCCVWNSKVPVGNQNENTLEEIFNNENMQEVRKQMINGEPPAPCYRCFQQESQGIQSLRVTANDRHRQHEHLIHEAEKNNYKVKDFNLYYWDFRIDNLCNMACRSCGPELSSLWHNDHYALYNRYIADNKKGLIRPNKDQLNQIIDIVNKNINDVERVYFAGGEPLINDMHYYILDRLIKAKRFDCLIYYNTNLSVLHYKKYDLIEMWNNFDSRPKKSIEIAASLDAIGPKAEYIRHGQKWNKIEKNIKKILETPNLRFMITPVISIFNIMHLPDYLDYFMLDCHMLHHDIMLGNVLTEPTCYHIATLPEHLKIKVRKLFAEYLENRKNTFNKATLDDISYKFNSILQFMDMNIGDESLLKAERKWFINMTTKLDTVRGQDFTKTFPELACLLN